MSLLVMPTFAQIGVTWPIKKTPIFSTVVQTPASGRGELRIPLMLFPRWDFVLKTEYIKGDAQSPIASPSNWQILVNFYMQQQGAASDWLFLDPYDNTVSNTTPQVIGTGDGTTTQFAIYRQLATGGALDLIQNYVSAPTIYVNGSAVSSSTYTINQFGVITFNSAPPNTQPVAWSGQFYYRCRFLEDSWSDLQEDFYQIWSLDGLKFRSVLL